MQHNDKINSLENHVHTLLLHFLFSSLESKAKVSFTDKT